MREAPSTWARWWVWMWALIVAALIVAAFIVPFGTWAVLAAVLFGVPEAVGIWHRGDRYPPLTYIAARLLPRWLVVALTGFLSGSIGAVWLGFARPLHLGALLALVLWAQDHWDVTYSTRRRWQGEKP